MNFYELVQSLLESIKVLESAAANTTEEDFEWHTSGHIIEIAATAKKVESQLKDNLRATASCSMKFFCKSCFDHLIKAADDKNNEHLVRALYFAKKAGRREHHVFSEETLRALKEISSHYEGNIRQAILDIRSQNWLYAIDTIQNEISERAKNEPNNQANGS